MLLQPWQGATAALGSPLASSQWGPGCACCVWCWYQLDEGCVKRRHGCLKHSSTKMAQVLRADSPGLTGHVEVPGKVWFVSLGCHKLQLKHPDDPDDGKPRPAPGVLPGLAAQSAHPRICQGPLRAALYKPAGKPQTHTKLDLARHTVAWGTCFSQSSSSASHLPVLRPGCMILQWCSTCCAWNPGPMWAATACGAWGSVLRRTKPCRWQAGASHTAPPCPMMRG